jgi:hypothetical protein
MVKYIGQSNAYIQQNVDDKGIPNATDYNLITANLNNLFVDEEW